MPPRPSIDAVPIRRAAIPPESRQRALHARRRLTALALLASLAVVGVYVGVGTGQPERGDTSAKGWAPATSGSGHSRRARVKAPAHAARVPLLVVKAHAPTGGWSPVAWVRGAPAAWLAQRSGVTLMRFDQGLVHLTLHAGSSDGGTAGWTYGDRIAPREIHLLVAAFNGGFKLTYPDVGFVSGGQVAVALKRGLASIVTYRDGRTNIGAWDAGVPSAHGEVFSVLQNQHLLVDRGVASASVSGCILRCWGATVGNRLTVARSGLGITASGQLVWAAGGQLQPADLASALIAAGAVRAIELDINQDWVAGYLYPHSHTGPTPVPVMPGQLGIAGQLLEPYSRDFLAVVAN